ncbi:hypothetical protein ACFS6H_20210 [Terrimonas rubra]|uniref:Uncharacterized protein n=1 Tax=Terrimonas rubra TaxID=1035890 RepID=A0ABW6ADA9_9BACT
MIGDNEISVELIPQNITFSNRPGRVLIDAEVNFKGTVIAKGAGVTGINIGDSVYFQPTNPTMKQTDYNNNPISLVISSDTVTDVWEPPIEL